MDVPHPDTLRDLKPLNVRLLPAAHAYLIETRRLIEEGGLAALPYHYQQALRETGDPTATQVLVTMALRNLLTTLDPKHGAALTKSLHALFGTRVAADPDALEPKVGEST